VHPNRCFIPAGNIDPAFRIIPENIVGSHFTDFIGSHSGMPDKSEHIPDNGVDATNNLLEFLLSDSPAFNPVYRPMIPHTIGLDLIQTDQCLLCYNSTSYTPFEYFPNPFKDIVNTSTGILLFDLAFSIPEFFQFLFDYSQLIGPKRVNRPCIIRFEKPSDPINETKIRMFQSMTHGSGLFLKGCFIFVDELSYGRHYRRINDLLYRLVGVFIGKHFVGVFQEQVNPRFKCYFDIAFFTIVWRTEAHCSPNTAGLIHRCYPILTIESYGRSFSSTRHNEGTPIQ